MFTGIITDIGVILDLQQRGDLWARIGCSYAVDSIELGASIACNGVCLTVIKKGNEFEGRSQNWFDVEISAESISLTHIAKWKIGTRLNLERALAVGDELGGHIVSGHVDGVADLISLGQDGDSLRMQFSVPTELSKFIAPKGSVTLNGTSLTVNEVQGDVFGVNVIPHTQDVTIWGQAKVGDQINLEIDTMARYVARYVERLEEWKTSHK